MIPFEISFVYTHPQIDSVPESIQVNSQELFPIEPDRMVTIDEAIDSYLEAYRDEFVRQYGLVKRKRFLYRFLDYLKARNHSLKLNDLTFEDCQRFLDSLVNAYSRRSLSSDSRKHDKHKLRMFGRFLAESKLIEEDVFFELV